MEKAHQINKPQDSGKTDWFGRFLVAFMLLVFVPFMIYLEANGTNTSELFSKVMGFVILGCILIAIGAVVFAIFNFVVGFLIRKK